MSFRVNSTERLAIKFRDLTASPLVEKASSELQIQNTSTSFSNTPPYTLTSRFYRGVPRALKALKATFIPLLGTFVTGKVKTPFMQSTYTTYLVGGFSGGEKILWHYFEYFFLLKVKILRKWSLGIRELESCMAHEFLGGCEHFWKSV